MKRLITSALLAIIPFAASGCGGGQCSDFCRGLIECGGSCDEFEDDLDEVQADCEDACNDATDGLSDSEAEQVDLCLTCISDELGSIDECNDDDWPDAAEDCDDECDDDDLEDFAEDFFDDFDPDCDGNVCDDAAQICGAVGEGEGEQVECSGQTQCAAQCIVSSNSCDTTDEALLACISGC